jgi:hypothetical protein
MTVPVEKLTTGQQALAEEVVRDWVGYGLSTTPADRAAAEAGVAQAYLAAGLDPPETVVWVDSPLAAALGAYQLSSMIGHEASHPVDEYLRAHLAWRFRRRIDARVRQTVRGLVTDRVSARIPFVDLHKLLAEHAGSRLWDRIGGQANDRIPARLRPPGPTHRSWLVSVTDKNFLTGRQARTAMLGQFAAPELAAFDLYHRIGVDPGGRIAGISQVARSASMWWPMLDAVVLSERPTEVHYDSLGNLHHSTKPAVRFRDGWGLHYWHGTRVPVDLIEGPAWTIKRIVTERDSEVRRCAVERAGEFDGWPELIARAGWRQVGPTVPDPGNPGQTLSLYVVPNIYREQVNLLLMTNGSVDRDGTRRQYAETVPARFTDPLAAAAWQIGLTADQYRHTVRRT